MPSDARAILTAAAHVLERFERGDFPPPDPGSGVSSIEWDDGHAALADDGRIRVTIPNGIRAALEEAYQCGWADAEAHHGLQD